MNGKHYIGDKAASFRSTGRTRGIDGVALVVDDGTEYRAGDQTGYVLELECPYGTQAMADALLEKLRGRSYEGFETTGAALPSAAELGDGVTVKGLYGPIVRRRVQFTGELASDVSAPTGGDTDHEFGYTDPTQRQIERAAARSRSYIDKKADEIRIGVEDEVGGVRGELSLKVGRNENDRIVSMLNASADEINIKGNRFVLDSDNFKVAADGTVNMTGANVAGEVDASAFTLQGAKLEVVEEGVATYSADDRSPYPLGPAAELRDVLSIDASIGVHIDSLYAEKINSAGVYGLNGGFGWLTANQVKAYAFTENGTALADKYMAKDAVVVETSSITIGAGCDWVHIDPKPGRHLANISPNEFKGSNTVLIGYCWEYDHYTAFFKDVSSSDTSLSVTLVWI